MPHPNWLLGHPKKKTPLIYWENLINRKNKPLTKIGPLSYYMRVGGPFQLILLIISSEFAKFIKDDFIIKIYITIEWVGNDNIIRIKKT